MKLYYPEGHGASPFLHRWGVDGALNVRVCPFFSSEPANVCVPWAVPVTVTSYLFTKNLISESAPLHALAKIVARRCPVEAAPTAESLGPYAERTQTGLRLFVISDKFSV